MKSTVFKKVISPVVSLERFVSNRVAKPVVTWDLRRRQRAAYSSDARYRQVEDLRRIPGSSCKVLVNDVLAMDDWDYQRGVEDRVSGSWMSPFVSAAFWVRRYPVGEFLRSRLFDLQVAERGFSDGDVWNPDFRIVSLCSEAFEARVLELASRVVEPGESLEGDLLALRVAWGDFVKLLALFDDDAELELGVLEHGVRVSKLSRVAFGGLADSLFLLSDAGRVLSGVVGALLFEFSKDLHGFPVSFYGEGVDVNGEVSRLESDAAFLRWRSAVEDASFSLRFYGETGMGGVSAAGAWLWVGEHLSELWD